MARGDPQIADSQNRNFPITRPLGIFSKLDAINPIDTAVDGKVSSADPFFEASRLKICTSLLFPLNSWIATPGCISQPLPGLFQV